jgi:hypothetical protein
MKRFKGYMLTTALVAFSAIATAEGDIQTDDYIALDAYKNSTLLTLEIEGLSEPVAIKAGEERTFLMVAKADMDQAQNIIRIYRRVAQAPNVDIVIQAD